MIMSGWILPDLYEVKCKSCSTSKGHIEIVKRYLANLKELDLKMYNNVINRLYNFYEHLPVPLDDFAVTHLNWIKVINYPINIIFCIKNHDLDFLIENYISFGYSLVTLETHPDLLHIPIPSNKLI